jgi:hypothetical protein
MIRLLGIQLLSVLTEVIEPFSETAWRKLEQKINMTYNEHNTFTYIYFTSTSTGV